jgi:hypothetical protein
VEAIKLFDLTIRDLNVTIDQLVKVPSLLNYIKKWRFELWELTFYREYSKVKGEITRGKTWQLQTRAKEALNHVFYK